MTPARALGALVVVLAPLLLSSCTGTRAGLITVTGPPALVRRLEVHIVSHDGKHSDQFVEPPVDGDFLAFPKTISITFPSSVSGFLDVHIDGKAGNDTVAAGNGFSTTPVSSEVTRIDVNIKAVAVNPTPDMAGSADLVNHD